VTSFRSTLAASTALRAAHLAEGVVGICGRYHTGWQRKLITANPMGIT
jgi:hypothetical protein